MSPVEVGIALPEAMGGAGLGLVEEMLVLEETGAALDVGREVSYYHGVDSDGSWSEGSRDDNALIPAVPAGRWFLRIDPEGPLTGNPIAYTVQVFEGGHVFFLEDRTAWPAMIDFLVA